MKERACEERRFKAKPLLNPGVIYTACSDDEAVR